VVESITGGQKLGFGGDMNITEVAVKFVHQMPSGGTVIVYLWRAQGSGEITITFGDEPHEFPYEFSALTATTDWAGNPLSSTERLCRIDLLGSF